MERKIDGIIGGVEEQFKKINNVRLTALDDLRDSQVLTRSLFQHDALRLEQKLGEDHPRVQNLKKRLAANLEIIRNMDLRCENARIRKPQVKEDDSLFHGRVNDANKRGLESLRINLVGEDRKAVEGVEELVTDGTGYYSFVIDPDLREKLAKEHKKGVNLSVSDKKGKRVFTSRKRFPLKKEGTYRGEEIKLDRFDLSEVPRKPPNRKPPNRKPPKRKPPKRKPPKKGGK